MKTSLLYPQSFFARTLWMVLLAVLFSKALTLIYLMLNEDVLVDRQYSQKHAALVRLQRQFRKRIALLRAAVFRHDRHASRASPGWTHAP